MIDIQVIASGSTGNCYRVSDGQTPLLLECGIPWKQIQQGLKFKTYEIAGCLISHEHGDHNKALQDVLKAGIDVYSSKGTFNGSRVELTHRTHVIESQRPFKVGSWMIVPFQTQHDCNEPLGFLLINQLGERLLFATDTYYIKYRFQGLTHIMIECNYAEDILRDNVKAGLISVDRKNRLFQSHFSLGNVKEFFKANDLSKVQEIYLIHLSGDNSDEVRFKKEIIELTGKPVFVA